MDLIGSMKKKVYFCLNNPTLQGAGEIDNYGVVLTTRGYLRRSNGSRGLAYGEIDTKTSWLLTVRYQQGIAVNVSVTAKFIIDNIWHTIDSWKKIDEDLGYYEFRLNRVEPVAAGSIDLGVISGKGVQSPLYLTGVDGQSSVSSALLAGATILAVARAGVLYKQVNSAPGNGQFNFNGTTITFDTVFEGSPVIYVLYKL